jgi:hypothetical protein
VEEAHIDQQIEDAEIARQEASECPRPGEPGKHDIR